MWFLKTVYPRLTLGKISGIRQMGRWPPILDPYRQPLLSNKDGDGDGYENVTKKVNSRCFKLYRGYSISFTTSNVGK